MNPSNAEIYALLTEVNLKLDRFFQAQEQSEQKEKQQIASASGGSGLKDYLVNLGKQRRAEEKGRL